MTRLISKACLRWLVSGMALLLIWRALELACSAQPNVSAWGDTVYGQTNVPAALTGAVAVAGGYSHSLGLKADGTVLAWGTSQGTNVPAGLENVVAVAAGGSFSLALKGDGSVAGWGDDTLGKMTPPPGLSNVVAIAAGNAHSLALTRDGLVVAWGNNGLGQATVPADLGSIVAIAAGLNHSLALRSDGTVAAWGCSSGGATSVPAGLTNAIAVAAGDYWSLALRADGTLLAWGLSLPAGMSNVTAIGAYGRRAIAIGENGTVAAWGSSAAVPVGLSNVVSVAAGANVYLAVTGDGPPVLPPRLADRMAPVGGTARFYCTASGAWPIGCQWQLNGTNIPGATSPMLVITNVSSADFGNYTLAVSNTLGTCAGARARLSPASVFGWGDNSYGQTNVLRCPPGVKAIAAGYYHCLALRHDGTVFGWGGGGSVEALPPSGLANVVAVAAGCYYSVAVKADGTVVAWGRGGACWSRTNLPAGLTNVAAVSAGYDHALALKSDGTVAAWGSSPGTGVPFRLTNVVAVAAGRSYSLAMKADGSITAWGSSLATAIPGGLSNTVAVAAGEAHALALGVDGTVTAWGDNSLGQATVPADLTNVTAIAAGSSHSVAVKADGTAVVWGSISSIPPGLKPLVTVAAGWNYCLALAGNGAPWVGPLPVNRLAFRGGAAAFYALGSGDCPLTYQWQVNGANIAGATGPALLLTNVQPSNAGAFNVFVTNSQGAFTNFPSLLTVCDFSPALNTSNITWTTIGDAPWFAQTNSSHDGAGAAQSGSLVGVSSARGVPYSTLEAAVTGPGTLSFWWKVSAAQFQFLSFFVNGGKVSGITGQTDWQQQSVFLGPGVHVLDWKFSTLVDVSSPSMAGLLDEVTFVPGVTAPTLRAQPVDQSQAPGANAAFFASAQGTPPFAYQWRFNGEDVPGGTGATLTITNVQPANVGVYTALVTNTGGSTLSSSGGTLVLGRIAAWGSGTIPPDVTNAVALAAGRYHSLALQSDHTVTAWANDHHGHIAVPPELTNIVEIAAGGWFDLALSADGTVLPWGDGSHGQTIVPTNLVNAIAIAGGGHHALALRPDGTVAAWGDNTYGQSNEPADLTNAVAIAAGLFHSLALRSDGTVAVWGHGSSGQTNVTPGLSNVVAIAGGFENSLALRADGTVAAWGGDGYGLTNIPANLTNVVAIAAGGYHNLALQADGKVVSWGNNFSGECEVPLGLNRVVAIAAGGYHSLALVGDGLSAIRILDPSSSADGFAVPVLTRNGHVYRLEYKNSLDAPAWAALPLVAGNGKVRILTDPAPTDSQRFYRVREW